MTTGYGARQQMLTVAADTLFHFHPNDGLAREFKRLVKQLGEPASARRNEIVHGIITASITCTATSRRDACIIFWLPAYHSAKRRDLMTVAAYRYSSKEIEFFRENFRRLAAEVNDFGSALARWRATLLRKGRAP